MDAVGMSDLAEWKAYLEARGFDTWVEYKEAGPRTPLAELAPVEERPPPGPQTLDAFVA
jgi:hypothetical protein